MNCVQLTGWITKTPELCSNQNGNSYCRITVAINRPKKEDGTQEADFISCVAWKNTAENICKYFDKGSLIGIEGKLQTGSYEAQDGTKRYTIDVLVSRFDFLESKGSKRPEAQEPDYVSQKEEDPFSEFGEQVTIDDNFLD